MGLRSARDHLACLLTLFGVVQCLVVECNIDRVEQQISQRAGGRVCVAICLGVWRTGALVSCHEAVVFFFGARFIMARATVERVPVVAMLPNYTHVGSLYV
jgi:hypothetical protein